MGKCQRLPLRSPIAIILLSRKTVTWVASKVTTQPASMIGAIPPSACWRPGTICAGTDNEGAMVVNPDVVACRVLPSGCIIGVRNGVILLFCDSRCACVEGYRMCVHPLSAINELLLIILLLCL